LRNAFSPSLVSGRGCRSSHPEVAQLSSPLLILTFNHFNNKFEATGSFYFLQTHEFAIVCNSILGFSPFKDWSYQAICQITKR